MDVDSIVSSGACRKSVFFLVCIVVCAEEAKGDEAGERFRFIRIAERKQVCLVFLGKMRVCLDETAQTVVYEPKVSGCPEILLVDALAKEKKPIIAAQPDINSSVKRPVIKNVFNLLVAGVLLIGFKKYKIQLFSV